MKAVKVLEANQLNIIEQPKPVIQNADEVLIKVKRVGICGSDMHIFHGTNPLATYPRVVGHEVAGEVVETGENVKGVKAGDHIVVEPISYCGTCFACRKGRPNVCEKLSVFGVHEDGGMREYIVLPEKQVHVINEKLSWDEAVLAEPYTIGAQAVWRGNVQAGDTVLIQGSGPIGICILKMALIQGATVFMTDLNDERLQFAKDNGAHHVINVTKDSLKDRLFELTENQGVNIVIDAVCLPSTVEMSLELVTPAGSVVILGFDERPSALPQLPITKKEITIVGSRLQTNQFGKVIELLNTGKLKANGLITHEFPLDRVQEAFNFVENNPEKVRKALINLE
ncbi:zinc-binding alcohol dehydrogenase family protein [Jeotgalibacillus proteolyticus]|uniref:Alcohol dehydrogenase n=1 Tax=Jeotgalibacillus proteolyticus TaxID=2082395 RepID=A0A2S5G885_9BACL|nr:zinc-binding alcohol dehydrogenase family protein [Jeotgalibacillus proteolyticus]PPA69131.1 alcohol dehydrogenase [Jeotgalibacillus proteolyticus]